MRRCAHIFQVLQPFALHRRRVARVVFRQVAHVLHAAFLAVTGCAVLVLVKRARIPQHQSAGWHVQSHLLTRSQRVHVAPLDLLKVRTAVAHALRHKVRAVHQMAARNAHKGRTRGRVAGQRHETLDAPAALLLGRLVRVQPAIVNLAIVRRYVARAVHGSHQTVRNVRHTVQVRKRASDARVRTNGPREFLVTRLVELVDAVRIQIRVEPPVVRDRLLPGLHFVDGVADLRGFQHAGDDDHAHGGKLLGNGGIEVRGTIGYARRR